LDPAGRPKQAKADPGGCDSRSKNHRRQREVARVRLVRDAQSVETVRVRPGIQDDVMAEKGEIRRHINVGPATGERRIGRRRERIDVLQYIGFAGFGVEVDGHTVGSEDLDP